MSNKPVLFSLSIPLPYPPLTSERTQCRASHLCLAASPAQPVICCLGCQQGQRVATATMTYDSGASDGPDIKQPAAGCRAAEWKSVAAGAVWGHAVAAANCQEAASVRVRRIA